MKYEFPIQHMYAAYCKRCDVYGFKPQPINNYVAQYMGRLGPSMSRFGLDKQLVGGLIYEYEGENEERPVNGTLFELLYQALDPAYPAKELWVAVANSGDKPVKVPVN